MNSFVGHCLYFEFICCLVIGEKPLILHWNNSFQYQPGRRLLGWMIFWVITTKRKANLSRGSLYKKRPKRPTTQMTMSIPKKLHFLKWLTNAKIRYNDFSNSIDISNLIFRMSSLLSAFHTVNMNLFYLCRWEKLAVRKICPRGACMYLGIRFPLSEWNLSAA